MQVELVVSNGAKSGQVISIRDQRFFIGRDEDCHLKPKSDLVSRHHCAICVEDAYVAIRDLGSKNGTFVNGEQVRGEQELKDGDSLSVGQLDFTVRLKVSGVGGEKKPKVKSVQEALVRTVENASDSTKTQKQDADDSSDDALGLEWLSEGEEESSSYEFQSEETRTFQMDADVETEIAKETSEETLADEPVADPEPAIKKPERKIVQQNIGNSGDAAADVLRNFFQGR
jgi:pSer/pThr/pTyr-binding forkhead associated (FHA) protein